MDVIVKPHGGGKTAELLAMLAADPKAILIVMSWQEKDRLVRVCKVPAQRVFIYDQANRGAMLSSMGGEVHLLIDNADMILGRIFGRPVKAITITG